MGAGGRINGKVGRGRRRQKERGGVKEKEAMIKKVDEG